MTDAAKVWSFGEMAWVGYLAARMGGAFLSSEQILEMQTRGGARGGRAGRSASARSSRASARTS